MAALRRCSCARTTSTVPQEDYKASWDNLCHLGTGSRPAMSSEGCAFRVVLEYRADRYFLIGRISARLGSERMWKYLQLLLVSIDRCTGAQTLTDYQQQFGGLERPLASLKQLGGRSASPSSSKYQRGPGQAALAAAQTTQQQFSIRLAEEGSEASSLQHSYHQ